MHEARMNGNSGGDTHIPVPKLADQIVVKDADIDRIGNALYPQIKNRQTQSNEPCYGGDLWSFGLYKIKTNSLARHPYPGVEDSQNNSTVELLEVETVNIMGEEKA